MVITTQPPHKCGCVGPSEHAGDASSGEVPDRQKESPLPVTEATSTAKKGKRVEFAPEPTHPYAAALDATFSILVKPAQPATKEPAMGWQEPGFHSTAKIYDPLIAKKVYERAMETPITVTQRELLSLAPEVRTHMADVTIQKRIPCDQTGQVIQ